MLARLATALALVLVLLPSGALAAVRPPKPPPPLRIQIDTDSRMLTVFSAGKAYASFPVAVGRPALPTPHGHWAVKNKAHWGGGFGTRWMELTVPFGIYGVHGTSNPGSIGSFASHGCIRMFNRHVETVYSWVDIGTPVDIVGAPSRRRMLEGERGSEVMEVQTRMRTLGLYEGPVDGYFNMDLKRAIERFQKDHGLRTSGAVDKPTYKALGLYPEGLVTYQQSVLRPRKIS